MAKGHLARMKRILAATAAAAAIAWASPALAQDLQLSIPARPATEAVATLARQANVQILLPGRTARGIRTNPVSGTMPVEDALRLMFDGTGLSARRTGPQTWTIVSAAEAAASGGGEAGSAAADDAGAEQNGISEILVVGSRSQNVDIVRTEDDPQPYVVFSRDEIQRSQAANLEEFFRTRLPMNSQLQSSATGAGIDGLTLTALGNNSQINLRGLGTNQTLVLVDGRRLPRVLGAVGVSVDFTQGDLNGIPLAAIERIEVLPSTAGGIYGGGAVGGVINIIRRRDYSGLDLRASYQGTFRGGGEMWQVDLSGGFSLDSRTQISFAGSWSDARPLHAGDNDLWRRGRELLLRNDPSNPLVPGYTPNIRSSTNLVLDDGTPLNARFTYIPIGYAGRVAEGDGGRALLANAGTYNLDLSNDTLGQYASLRSDPRVRSGNVNVRREFLSWLSGFADFTYGENLARSNYSGVQIGTTVNADAPNNPFRQNITVTYPVSGAELPARIETTTLSTTAGLIFRPSRNWSATAEYSFSRSSTRTDSVFGPLTSAAATAIRTGALDVLRDLNRYPVDFTPFLPTRNLASPRETRQQIFSARAAGTLFELPGGPVRLTALLERREEVAAPEETRSAAGAPLFYRPQRSQSNNAAYAELLVPVVSARNARPLVRALELQMSVRHDRYRTLSASPSDFTFATPTQPLPAFTDVENRFSSTDYTVALRWQPVEDITLRASYATGFLPASISQLVGQDNPAPVTTQRFLDPRRGNTPNQSYLFRLGGNPGLLPEQSRSFSLGAIVTPTFVPALRLSVDYTSIRKTNEIVAPQDQDIVSNEDLFPGRVRRGANLPGDQPGWAGPVTFLDRTLTNFARTRNESLDFQADYEFSPGDFGTFHIFAVATRQLRLRRQFLTTTTLYDLVDTFEGPLKWRGNAGIDWRLDGWRAGWATQYYNSYSVLYGDPAQAGAGASQLVRQGSARIPDQAYHDVYLGYDFPRSGHPLAGTRVSLGIQNLFDHRPPPIAFQINGYSRYGDPRLRRFTLTLAKSF